MKVKYTESILYKITCRVQLMRRTIILRKDFNDLGSYRQISRALNNLVTKKKLVKISTGIYAKSYPSKYQDTPVIKNGIDSTFRKALDRLDIAYEPGSAEKQYNEGRSTQIPVRNIVRLKSRCRRKISYKNSKLIFEDNINAK